MMASPMNLAKFVLIIIQTLNSIIILAPVSIFDFALAKHFGELNLSMALRKSQMQPRSSVSVDRQERTKVLSQKQR